MIKESGIVERIPSNPADLLMLCTADPVEAATLIAELQAELTFASVHAKEYADRALAAESSQHRVRGEMIEDGFILVPREAWSIMAMRGSQHTKVFEENDYVGDYFDLSETPKEFAPTHRFDDDERPWRLCAVIWRGMIAGFEEWQRRRAREGDTPMIVGWEKPYLPAVADTNADAPGNVGLLGGVSTDQTSLNITGLDAGAVKTAESSHSPSTLNAETELAFAVCRCEQPLIQCDHTGCRCRICGNIDRTLSVDF